jgi:hypothetical protein
MASVQAAVMMVREMASLGQPCELQLPIFILS